MIAELAEERLIPDRTMGCPKTTLNSLGKTSPVLFPAKGQEREVVLDYWAGNTEIGVSGKCPCHKFRSGVACGTSE